MTALMTQQTLKRSDEESAAFFLVVPPHFEKLALYELHRVMESLSLPLPPYEIFVGGIELNLPLSVGFSLNTFLKIPNRILWRLGTKEILSYEELKKWLLNIDFKVFCPLGEVSVSSRSSKLKMKEDIKKFFIKTMGFKPSKMGTDVYIRFFRDQCTLSIDTSGEDLYRRGYQKWTGAAPIRDNMASGLLQLALQGVVDLSQWQVADPMMGSGTLLLEATQLGKTSSRSFGFQKWKIPQSFPLISETAPSGPAILGRDLLDKNVEIARKNFASLGMKDMDLKKADLLKEQKSPPAHKRRLVIINPPYGERIKINETEFFQKMVDQVVNVYNPERMGFILPQRALVHHKAYERVREFPFSNNGIDVVFHLFLKEKRLT